MTPIQLKRKKSFLLPNKMNAQIWLTPVNIKEDDIYLTLKNLNPEIAHGQDNISISMI